MYVIYHKESTYYLTSKNFKTEGAAKSYMTREAKKNARAVEVNNIYKRLDTADRNFRELMDALEAEGLTKREAYNAGRDVEKFNRDDYAIADAVDFHNNIEKTRMTRNILNPNSKEFAIPVNTPNSCDPGSETYHCM
jgi:hypothetical protein